jgi:hypothetical protein
MSSSAEKEGTPQDGILQLLSLEIVRKDEYSQWLKDPCYVGEVLAQQRQRQQLSGDVDLPPVVDFQQRLDITHLSRTLAAFHARLPQLVSPPPSYAKVRGMVQPSSSQHVIEYILDDDLGM